MARTILVPTDGSDDSLRAARLAGELGGKDGNVILLQVRLREQLSEELRHMAEVEHLEGRAAGSGARAANIPAEMAAMLRAKGSADETEATLTKVGEWILKRTANAVEESGGHVSEQLLEDGDVARRIIGCADDKNVDMIVMGSRGLGSIQELLLGSVSQKVTNRAKCTVVTVR